MTAVRSARASVAKLPGAIAGLMLALGVATHGHASQTPGAAADDELRARIEAKLASLDARKGAEIRVAVRDGQVILQGRVRVLEQSLRAEQAAWKTPGVLDVDNELRVVPRAAGGDAAIEREVRMMIVADARFTDAKLEVEVNAGLVALRGLFRHPGDVLVLKHRVASIDGVLEVEIDALLVALQIPPSLDHALAFSNEWTRTFYL